MTTPAHTITIEPQSTYPGGISQYAIVERVDGRLIAILGHEDMVQPGHTLAEAAEQCARECGATYTPGSET